jgi:hypothetical protein
MDSERIACDLSEQSKSWDWHVRRKVAWNKCISDYILRQLSTDEVQWVREAVAGNGRSPGDVLIGLANDRDGFVRAAVALNERTPTEILDDLAADEMMDYDYTLNKNRYLVKEAVARNPKVCCEKRFKYNNGRSYS